MFSENFFFKAPRKENRRKKEEPESSSRRNFLKLSGAVAALAAGTWAIKKFGGVEKALEFLEEEKEKNKTEVIFVGEEDPDIEAVNEIIDFYSEKPIEINQKTADDTQEYWRIRHMTDRRLADSLVGAVHNIEQWVPQLKKIFNEEGVPEEYLYLAIPESYWRAGKKSESPAGARGYYQFTVPTARKYGLRINSKIDERDDPLKSARACAKNLKYLYEEFKDWDMALAGYNGGLIWHYRKYARRKKEKESYGGLLEYLSGEANEIREEIRTRKYFKYKLKKKEDVKKLALKFGVNEDEIKKGNRGIILKPGMKANIPYKKKDLLKMYRKRIGSISENLNYPPKFNAVLGLIEKGVG